MQCPWQRQHEFRNFDLKLLALFRHAEKLPLHGALWRRKRRTTRIFEFLTGFEQWLPADDTQPADFLDMVVGIRNNPVTRYQLRADLSCIPYRDGIGKNIAAPLRSKKQ